MSIRGVKYLCVSVLENIRDTSEVMLLLLQGVRAVLR